MVLTRQHMIEDYLKSHAIRKLQVGSGGHVLRTWLNTDINPAKGAMFLDATQRFPFEDETFHYICCEHFIEHLEYREGRSFLRECFRILRRGGKIRVATPDLSFVIRLYRPEKTDLEERYISWVTDHVLPHIGIRQDTFVINNAFRGFGHRFIYDFKALSGSLDAAGYVHVTRCNVGESDDENFQGVESHGEELGEDFNRLETIVVQALKPS